MTDSVDAITQSQKNKMTNLGIQDPSIKTGTEASQAIKSAESRAETTHSQEKKSSVVPNIKDTFEISETAQKAFDSEQK